MDKHISRFKSRSNASNTSDKCTDDQSCHLDEDSGNVIVNTGIAPESNVTCDVSSLSDGKRSISPDLSHTPLGLTITSNSRAEQTCSHIYISCDSDTKTTSKRSNEDNSKPYLKDYFTFILFMF